MTSSFFVYMHSVESDEFSENLFFQKPPHCDCCIFLTGIAWLSLKGYPLCISGYRWNRWWWTYHQPRKNGFGPNRL